MISETGRECVSLTGAVDFSESEDIQQRKDTAVGQVEPHQGVGHRVSVHRHHLLQGRQHRTPFRLGEKERETAFKIQSQAYRKYLRNFRQTNENKMLCKVFLSNKSGVFSP